MTDNKAKYEERMNRINTAIALKEPDRVPIIPFAQCYPVLHAGHTMAEARCTTQMLQKTGSKNTYWNTNRIWDLTITTCLPDRDRSWTRWV